MIYVTKRDRKYVYNLDKAIDRPQAQPSVCGLRIGFISLMVIASVMISFFLIAPATSRDERKLVMTGTANKIRGRRIKGHKQLIITVCFRNYTFFPIFGEIGGGLNIECIGVI